MSLPIKSLVLINKSVIMRRNIVCGMACNNALHKYMFIATGTIAFVYMMLKLIQNKSEKTTKKESSEEITDQQTTINTLEIAEPKIISNKRKLEDTTRAMKVLRPKPNFFVAFQVNDVGIHQKVKKLQEKLLIRNPKLFSALINVSTLHITLAVTHLASETDIKIVNEKLNEWAAKNTKKYFGEPCILNFSGVKTFNNVVAYVDLEQNDNYKKILAISKNINHILTSAGFSIDKKSCTPHLTFLKLSKDFKLLKNKKLFQDDFEFLKKNREHFGKQEVTHIQLLNMDEPKDEFGYYKCYHQIKVSDGKQISDHSECCRPIQNMKKAAE